MRTIIVPRGGPAGELALGPASPLRAALHAVPLIPDGAICRRDLRAEINNQRGTCASDRRPWPSADRGRDRLPDRPRRRHRPDRQQRGEKKIKGRKRHVAVDTGGLLLAVVVTTASLQDRDGAFRITAALREAFSTITLV
jgi:hypothetical protein